METSRVARTKEERTLRLRDRVRREGWACVQIQKMFRGGRVRSAVHSWVRDYWIEVIDDYSGTPYWTNTWSSETRWIKPLEMTLAR